MVDMSNPSGPLSKSLLEHSHAIYLHIIYVCFHATVGELSCCNRDRVDDKARNIYLFYI